MTFQRILIALDADTSSSAALTCGASLAKDLGASLRVMHAWEAPGYTLGTRANITEEALLGAATAAVQRFLDERLAPVRVQVPGVTGVVRRGEAAAEILVEIAEAKADLIVMGSHGRGGVERVVLGSVAAAVVRASKVPVLVLGPSYPPPVT